MKSDIGIKSNILLALIKLAEENALERLVVFGSRARGDYHKTSDIDLAIKGGNSVNFAVEVDEQVPTLLKFDIIDLGGTVQPELLESIEREGVVLYEKV